MPEMPLPNEINFDKIVLEVLKDLAEAYQSWMGGVPRDEITLMSRLTERLMRNRRKCDIGSTQPMQMEADFHELHRKGKHSVDQYGADIAVTVRIPSQEWVKTCFFQFKVGDRQKAMLEREQLEQPTEFTGVDERSFVLAVDETTMVFRVEATKNCRDAIPSGMGSKTFDVSGWRYLSDWLLRWFKCMEGRPTKPDDPAPVEELLKKYVSVMKQPDLEEILRANLPTKVFPAKVWLDYRFKPAKSE